MHDVRDFIKKELVKFTGLSIAEVENYISRKKYPHFKDEWKFWNPDSNENIRWFYMSSTGYLFGNASHRLPIDIYNDIKAPCKVLDFGGGSGNYSIPLAQKGCEVFYFDISIIQKDFIKFVAKGNNLNIKTLNYDKEFMPIIDEKVDVIIALDVIEHIHNYNEYIKVLSENLNDNGRMYVFAPFGSGGDPTHLKDHYNLNKVMKDNNLDYYKKILLNNGVTGSVYIKK